VYVFKSSNENVSKASFILFKIDFRHGFKYVYELLFVWILLCNHIWQDRRGGSTFMPNYQIPLGLVAIGVPVLAYYSTHKRILGTCSVKLI
jgi:hypothetical protein